MSTVLVLEGNLGETPPHQLLTSRQVRDLTSTEKGIYTITRIYLN